MSGKIYAVDFDGTIVENKWPEIGDPNFILIDFLKERKADGDFIILWTCRNGDLLSAAIKFCKEYGLEFDAVNENLPYVNEYFGSDSRKIYADHYIDDKNYPVCDLPYISPSHKEW